jgi:hypothetical protein
VFDVTNEGSVSPFLFPPYLQFVFPSRDHKLIDLFGGGDVGLERIIIERERQKVEERTEREIGAFEKRKLLPNILRKELNKRMD